MDIKLLIRSRLLLLLAICTVVTNLFAQPTFVSGVDPKPDGKAWSKVTNMSDEFEGTELDLEKWQEEPVENGWVWLGRPPGLFDPSAISVDEGKLRVTVSVLDAPITINSNEFLYQGAIVRSINPGVHGWYYEAKMKANKTEMSSTFWLMSQNSDCMKKCELDIQECVGNTTELTDSWGQNWNQIFHSNCIHRTTSCVSEATQKQGQFTPDVKNWERYFVYAAWWKSPTEVRFYLDGEYKYTINPSTDFDVQAWIQMAIETYSWNPVPDGGGKVATEDWEGRTTQYDWVRVWKLTDSPGKLDTDSNLVKNPGFENANFDYWENTGTAEINTEEQNTGLFATKVCGTSTVLQTIPIYPNETYTFSAKAKVQSGGLVSIGIRGDGVAEESSITSTSYETVNFTYTSSATDISVEIYAQVNAEGDTAYIDDFMLLGEKPPSMVTAQPDNKANNFVVYPNPLHVGSIATLETSLLSDTEIELSVYNHTGKLLFYKNMGRYRAGVQTLDFKTEFLNMNNEGLYIVKLNTGNQVGLNKVIVQ